MPSLALQQWLTMRSNQLDEIAAAHSAIGGSSRGRRYATQQVNQAYAVLLSSQFQGYCRELHTEALDKLVRAVVPAIWQPALLVEFTRDRKLDRGNPNPGNIGADFNRLGLDFWPEVQAAHRRNAGRQAKLEELAKWRNAISHQDFDPAKLGGRTELQLGEVRAWRSAVNALAMQFDFVIGRHLETIIGAAPW